VSERRIERTMKLRRPLKTKDGDVEELVFYEPSGLLYDELEEAQTLNERAKKPSDVRHTGKLTLRHLTGLSAYAIGALSFRDRARAMEIAGEILEEQTSPESGDGEGSEDESGNE